MKRDFFEALAKLVELAADPETAVQAEAALAYCAAELSAMAERAEQRRETFWRLREDAWLVLSEDDCCRVWLESGGRRQMVLETQDRSQAEQVTAAMRQVVEE